MPPPKKYKKPESIGDLSDVDAIADIGGLDAGELADTPGKDHNPGRGIYRAKLREFAQLDDAAKHVALKDTWKEVAMGAAMRAKAFVATCSPKDFTALQRLITSGALSLEQAYPPKTETGGPKFIMNLFGSLGTRAAAIATPSVPTIDVIAEEVEWPSSSMISTTASSPTVKEISTTTKQSTPS